MSKEHTPTPWNTDGYYIETKYETVASCGSSTLTAAEDHANAAHIVKCVNMHDELVGALRLLLSSSYDYQTGVAEAEETLKKAGAL